MSGTIAGIKALCEPRVDADVLVVAAVVSTAEIEEAFAMR
jgi:hypothetical protein